MVRPRFMIGAVLIAGGMFLPPMSAPLKPVPDGVIGMTHEGYASETIRIHVGDTITFQNNSRWIHVIGPGYDGVLSSGYDKVEMLGDDMNPHHMGMALRTMVEEDGSYTTEPWNVPGTFLITCTVHPEMNAKVIVTE